MRMKKIALQGTKQGPTLFMKAWLISDFISDIFSAGTDKVFWVKDDCRTRRIRSSNYYLLG